jgi:hypothetical protein
VKRSLALLVGLAMFVIFGGATLVSADCAYHKSQAATEKSDPAKNVTSAPQTDKASANQVQTAEVNKSDQAPTERKNKN